MICRSCGAAQDMTDPTDLYTLVSHPLYTKGETVWLCNTCCYEICDTKTREFKINQDKPINYRCCRCKEPFEHFGDIYAVANEDCKPICPKCSS